MGFSRMTSRQERGRRSECLAREVLKARGYVILETNVRFPVGEIDIVARDGRCLCFVEVRSTSTDAFGGALASIGPAKQRRLIRAARWYLQRLRPLPPEIRFDVVAVDWQQAPGPLVELVQAAFMAE